MNQEERFLRLTGYVLGDLTADEEREMHAHLETCEDCQREAALLRESLSSLPCVAPPVAPPASVRKGLLARVAASQMAASQIAEPRVEATNPRRVSADSGGASHARRWRWSALAPYAAAAVVAFVAGVFFTRVVYRPVPQPAPANRLLEELAAAIDRAESSEVRIASYRGSGAQQSAFMVWDHAAGQIHFYTQSLPEPAAGQRYVLWFESSSGQWLRVASLDPDPSGGFRAIASFASDQSDVVRSVVTLEAGLEGDVPVGKHLLSASFQPDSRE